MNADKIYSSESMNAYPFYVNVRRLLARYPQVMMVEMLHLQLVHYLTIFGLDIAYHLICGKLIQVFCLDHNVPHNTAQEAKGMMSNISVTSFG